MAGVLGSWTPSWLGGTFGAPGEEQSVSGFADPAGPRDSTTGTPLAENTSDWLSKATNPALVQALQDASKSSLAQQPANTPLAAPTPMKLAAGGPMRTLSLDALVQLLEKQRAQYGTLSGQPVQRSQVLGLLGF